MYHISAKLSIIEDLLNGLSGIFFFFAKSFFILNVYDKLYLNKNFL
jgi:hypothetical protein